MRVVAVLLAVACGVFGGVIGVQVAEALCDEPEYALLLCIDHDMIGLVAGVGVGLLVGITVAVVILRRTEQNGRDAAS